MRVMLATVCAGLFLVTLGMADAESSSADKDHMLIEAAVPCENEAGGLFSILLAWIIYECRREAFETEARRGFSHVRLTQAYWQSVEEAEREKPRRARGSDDAAGSHE